MSESESAPEHGSGRRSREEARDEILAAAESFLWERPVRDLTVAELMERTTIGRSAFYAYFSDRYQVVGALLERLEAELLKAAQPWLRGPGDSDPLADVRLAVEATVGVWVEHGPVLRAIAEAASQDPKVEAAYRWGLLERVIVAVAKRIRVGQSRGRIRPVDPRETAAALILMNERYLADRMGTPPQAPAKQVVETVYGIWSHVLYGPAIQVRSGGRKGSRDRRAGKA